MKRKLDILKYLNLYLGSEFYFLTNGIKYHGVAGSVMDTGCCSGNIDATMWLNETRDDEDFKLILIAPTDMSEAQKKKYYSLTKKVENTIVDTPDSLRYCFSIGVDMFDLIEKGLAVDKKNVVYKKIIEKDYKNEDEEIIIVEINNPDVLTDHKEASSDNSKLKRSDIVGELYELIVSQNIIPLKKEENPFGQNHASMWNYEYLNFIHDGVDWSIRKATRINRDSDKYKIGESVYMICQGVYGIRMLALKDLIQRIKERISGGHEKKPVEALKEDVIVKRAKYVPDPNWKPPHKIILND